MANLVIKKNTNLTFTFILDGDTDNAVIDNQPKMTSTGVYFNFKTENGANIIKKQFIQYSQITYKDVSNVEFTFLSVQDVWTKLINEGFFDYLGTSGGGGGVTRFDELDDTFSYIGNDGKVPVVNQAENKLDAVTFYNFKDFIQLEDVAIEELIENKIVSVALVSGVPKLVLKDNPADPVQLANVVGYMVYADEATQITPIAFTTGVYVKITNDTLGAKTNVTNAPYGISSVWNESTNQFDFSQLSIGDQIDFNFDGNVTTTSSNQVVRLEVRLAIGSPSEETHTIFAQQVKTAATNERVIPYLLTIENDDYRNYPSEVWFVSDGNGSLSVKEFLTRIIRKGINIVDIDLVVDEAISSDINNNLVLGSDGKLYIASYNKGDYNISTNTPTLIDGTGRNGDYYYCTVAGSRNFGSGSITVGIGDRIEYNGTTWFKAVNNNQSASFTPQYETITSSSLSSFDVTGALAYLNAKSPNIVIGANSLLKLVVSDIGQVFEIKVNNRTIGTGQTALTSSDILEISPEQSFEVSRWTFTDFYTSQNNSNFLIGASVNSGVVDAPTYTSTSKDNFPSSILISSGVSNNGGYRFTGFASGSSGGGIKAQKGLTFFGIISICSNSSADTIIRLGLHTSVTQADSTDGAYLEIQGTSATFKVANNSARSLSTPVSLSYSTTPNEIYYSVMIHFETLTSVICKIKDDSGAVIMNTPPLTINTPTSGRRFGVGVIGTITTAGANRQILECDYIGVGVRKPNFLKNF